MSKVVEIINETGESAGTKVLIDGVEIPYVTRVEISPITCDSVLEAEVSLLLPAFRVKVPEVHIVDQILVRRTKKGER